ncbi:MAG: CDP-glycerol glycerophosphotransferase family protein, partial [Mailhella sp.]|nr:CDP-glycerol glycerophosphotransferase family protein [Mailhella sp.]
PLVDFLDKHFQPATYPSAYYYKAEHFDFIHSMFVKKPCRLRYSVITACYNVEKYVDEMLESLALQTVDFEQNIECIFVDDGSTDGTADKIKEWAKKYSNIRYIHKENGGVSSARNTGLPLASNPWVTFIDPDDFLHPDYFYQIDSYLADHEEETAFVAGRIVFYYEKNKKFSSRHNFDHKFKHAVNEISIHDINKELQFAANSAFFNKDTIINNTLKFPPKCQPKFEDANFICKYMYYENNKNAVFLKNSLYLYRKRSDLTSLIDTSWSRRESYGDLFEYGYIDICDFYIQKTGNIPAFLQNMIMYELCWYFRILSNKPSRTAFLSDQEVERFWELFSRLVSYLDENSIAYGPWEWIGREDRVPMIERILNKPYPQEEYLVCGYDTSKNLFHVSHVEAEGNSGTVFIGGVPTKPVFTKIQKRTFMRRDWAEITHEWYSLNDVSDSAEITALMADGRSCTIHIPNKFWGGSLPLTTLRDSFPLPPAADDSRFADAWLIMDRDESADDNGEHFYRWLMKHHPEQRAFFVLRKDTRDWHRLEQEGFVLVDFNSPDYEELFKNCSKIISAHADHYIFSSFPEHRYKDFVFLQHGILHNELSGWVNGFPATLFLTAAKREYESLAGNFNHYKYSKKEVALTGLPRHDAILAAPIKKQKQILIMPTWRNYIVGQTIRGNERAKNPAFMKTTYFKAWYSLLHSEQLKALAQKYGFEVVFYPHQNCQPYMEDFDCPQYIRTVHQGECGIQELFLNASVMITDFSSVAMDMAYAVRAVLYYQFDEEEFFRKHFEKGYFDYRSDGFGPVAVKEEEVLYELEKILENGGEMAPIYKERVDSFFAYRDGKCCERTYEAICNLDSPQ